MVVIDNGTWFAIPVIQKETGKIIMIRNTRFNPEYHEYLDDGGSIKKEEVAHLHEKQTIEIVSEPQEETQAVVPKKKRGCPKGGWPKKK